MVRSHRRNRRLSAKLKQSNQFRERQMQTSAAQESYVLVVDDNEEMCQMLARLLSRHELATRIATDGDIALSIVPTSAGSHHPRLPDGTDGRHFPARALARVGIEHPGDHVDRLPGDYRRRPGHQARRLRIPDQALRP